MSPTTPKRVVFCGGENVVISTPPPDDDGGAEEGDIPQVTTPTTGQSNYRKELFRLESLVRCHVQHQWQLSVENYSKLRKRQSSNMSTTDAEVASNSSAECTHSPSDGDPGSAASIAQLNKEVQEAWSAIDFGHKPSLWRKTIRSVILRLRGQEQHKDVYVMPQHLRDQLKQMYVY